MLNQEAEKRNSDVKTNLHKGHRQRQYDNYLKNGFSSFHPHEVLEFILFYGVHIKDTNEIAHELINKFGSFDRVLEAPINELITVNGMGKTTAILLKMIFDINQIYMQEKCTNIKIIKSKDDAVAIVKPYFVNQKEEKVMIICMDMANRILSVQTISTGTPGSVSLSVRQVLECALLYKSSSIILVHNHPSGNALASNEDIILTGRIKEALLKVEITLYDHIIITDNDDISFKETFMLI